MCMVWALNLLAVGQEDGTLCVMNSDSGSKYVSECGSSCVCGSQY